MRFETAFPSDFIKASDLNGAPVTVTIKNYAMDEIKDSKTGKTVKKPVLEFRGTNKKLVLNITNAKKIAAILDSPEMDDWLSKKIVLYPTVVEFAGDEVEAIRVRAAAPAAAADRITTGKAPAPAPEPAPIHDEEDPGAGLDAEDIPFSPEFR